MGQKVNPHGLRVGVIKDWDSRWYARNEKVGDLLVEDKKIRDYLKKTLYSAGIPKIEIERDNAKVRVYLHCARPGVVIGKGGEEINKIQAGADQAMVGKPVDLKIVEVRNADMDAQLVAENIAQQLEKRIGFRRAMKNAMGRAMRAGARGIKTCCSGRLGGAGDRPHRALSRRHHPPADPPRRHRLRLRGGRHHLRPHRREGVDLQGRGPDSDPAHHPPHPGYQQALSGAPGASPPGPPRR